MQLKNLALSFVLFTALFSPAAHAQTDTSMIGEDDAIVTYKSRKFYWGNGLDAALLQTSIFKRPAMPGLPAKAGELTTLRFSYILNFGFDINYDVNPHVGFFSGLGIKNIGFIEKVKDSTIKRRVYAFGAPVGIKLGNLKKRNFFFAGGGIDVPFHYKEKGFVKRNDKVKFREWFSDRTSHFMPYAFVGFSKNPGLTLKLQYYPTNFINSSYSTSYIGYSSNLIMLSVGIDIHYNSSPKAILKNRGIATGTM